VARDAVTEGARVLVVASEDTAAAWAARLVDEGVPAFAVPWSTIAPGPDLARAAGALRAAARGAAANGPADPRPVVILTSRNGVRFLPARAGHGLAALVVGAATATAANDAGFVADAGPAAESAAGFASVVRRLLAASGAPRTALWLRGDAANREGVELLAAAGWRIEEFVTYVATSRPAFAADVRGALPARAWVVGSPAAAAALVTSLGPDAFPPRPGCARVFVPGETTAAAVSVAGRVVPEVVAGLPDGLATRFGAARGSPTSPTRP